MSDAIIKVEGLGKKYLLRHQATSRRYMTLRDLLADKAKSLFRKREPDKGNRKSVEEFWALKDVSFEIKQGEAVGIIGRNGAGKSTLLKLLSRITEPTKGRIRLRGRVASLLEVGTGFHPELTGRENIFLNGAVLGMARTEIKKKFDEIVAFAEVEKFLDTPVKRYSSGMYMRLAFAVAAHLEPDILIVDEVLAVGDQQFQQKCIGKMQNVSQSGRTVLFVSHNMDAIVRMCSRCILLNQGMVETDCTVKEAVTLYVASKKQQSATVDLGPARRQWEPRLNARFQSIKMAPAPSLTDWGLPYGERLGFEILVEARQLVADLEIGMAISTATGNQFTANLSSETLPLKKVAAGAYVYAIEFPGLRLIPGSYYALLWMRSGAGMEDFIPQAFEFEVLISETSAQYKTDTFDAILVPQAEHHFTILENNQSKPSHHGFSLEKTI
jgi:lipopolysaccharide transport system ATP-binding protein